MQSIVIRRSGTLIDLGGDKLSRLDKSVFDLIAPELEYEHKQLLRGKDRYCADGTVRNIQVTKKKMYTREEGRLVTGFGFLSRIVELCQKHNIQIEYVDISPKKRPNVYTPDWDNVHKFMTFRPKQELFLQYLTKNECGVVNATVGFGKTYMFQAICHLYPLAKIDIVVGPKDVAKKIVSRLSESIPNVGQVGGGKRRKGDRVTVYLAKSAHHARGSDADFLLADEAHQLTTDKISAELAAAWRFTRNFGFTATPDKRMDGSDARLELFFGKEIFKLTYEDAVKLGLVVPMKVRWLDIDLPYNPAEGKSDTPMMRWGIWRNHDRNKIIANDIRKHYPDPDTQILILVATVDHAVHLSKELPEFSLCYGSMDEDTIAQYKRAKLLPSDFDPTTPERRDQMRIDFESGKLKRVIATDVWSTGVDFAALKVLYRADARTSAIIDVQGPGRASRISPTTNKTESEIIDCYDRFDPNFQRRSEARSRSYKELGWQQDLPRRIGYTYA